MSKSTWGFILTEIPENCGTCRKRRKTGDHYLYCGELGFDYGIEDYTNKKPEWCPIKEFPERKQVSWEVCTFWGVAFTLIHLSWNKCLDEILASRKKDEEEL